MLTIREVRALSDHPYETSLYLKTVFSMLKIVSPLFMRSSILAPHSCPNTLPDHLPVIASSIGEPKMCLVASDPVFQSQVVVRMLRQISKREKDSGRFME